jgi:hypothetical protein
MSVTDGIVKFAALDSVHNKAERKSGLCSVDPKYFNTPHTDPV